MNIKKRIYLCKNMTPVESEIASFVLENMKSVSQMNIMELSEAIPVSKSAIHRFCKKLNFHLAHITSLFI